MTTTATHPHADALREEINTRLAAIIGQMFHTINTVKEATPLAGCTADHYARLCEIKERLEQIARELKKMPSAAAAPDPERKPGDPLGPNCEHGQNEDCMNCRECGKCSESVDENDVCDDCRDTPDRDGRT